MTRLLHRYILACGLWLLLIWSPTYSAGLSDDHTIFDRYFRYSTARFLQPLTGGDYRWLHSQCWVESRLNPLAVSPVGARGICQFMPLTWVEVSRQMRINASVFDPRANILAAGFYMRRLSRAYTAPRAEDELRRWSWGAYNAGLGTILRAQRRVGGSIVWDEVSGFLPGETRDYVYRIEYHFYCDH